jgi:FKBP-type peptidyl-prolyl cis-trans isomerase
MRYFVLSLLGIFVFGNNGFGQKLITGYSKDLETKSDSILYGTAYYKTIEAKNETAAWGKKSYKEFSYGFSQGLNKTEHDPSNGLQDEVLLEGKTFGNIIREIQPEISEEQEKIIFQGIKDGAKEKTKIMNSAEAIEYFSEIKASYDKEEKKIEFREHTNSYPNLFKNKMDSLSYSLGYTMGENILNSEQAANLIIVEEFYPAFMVGLRGDYSEPSNLEMKELQKAFQNDQDDPKVKTKITALEGARMGDMYRKLAAGLDDFSLDSNLIELGLDDFRNYGMSYVDSASRIQFLILTQTKMQELKQIELQEQAEVNIVAGKKYIAEIAGEDGVMKTPNGSVIKIIKEGTGDSPDGNDIVVVHYEGKRIDGTKFDSSYDRGQTVEFGLQNVIRGWTEGLQFMREGGEYLITIPYDQAYGMNPRPGGKIQPGDTLVFKIELVEVKPVP